jgi:hypothetical protein
MAPQLPQPLQIPQLNGQPAPGQQMNHEGGAANPPLQAGGAVGAAVAQMTLAPTDRRLYIFPPTSTQQTSDSSTTRRFPAFLAHAARDALMIDSLKATGLI